MTEHDDTLCVRDMLDAARQAIKISAGTNRADLDAFDTETLALRKLLEIMGEASRRTGSAFRERHTEIDWKSIAGMRDRLIHGYDRVDYDVLWDTCTLGLPSLVTKLEKVLRDEVGE